MKCHVFGFCKIIILKIKDKKHVWIFSSLSFRFFFLNINGQEISAGPTREISWRPTVVIVSITLNPDGFKRKIKCAYHL